MTVVHLLVRNHQQTVARALESVSGHADGIVVGSLGSTDDTVEICRSLGATVFELGNCPRNEARNLLAQQTTGVKFFLEPWEAVVQGHSLLRSCSQTALVRVLTGKQISKEVRFWRDEPFINPVFEQVDSNTGRYEELLVYSSGRKDYMELLPIIQQWKTRSALLPTPHYYEACTLLALDRYDEFLQAAEYFMFLDHSQDVAATMNRYYYAWVQTTLRRACRPALQNLNLCLCANPLMAEFWCLIGDIHYHLLHQFEKATEFYENAMVLGSRRKSHDRWPLDIPKYKTYPEKMIRSCQELKQKSARFSRCPQGG